MHDYPRAPPFAEFGTRSLLLAAAKAKARRERMVRAALARARASGKPAVLHCLLDAEAITPGSTLQSIREAALARD